VSGFTRRECKEQTSRGEDGFEQKVKEGDNELRITALKGMSASGLHVNAFRSMRSHAVVRGWHAYKVLRLC
jgi:hypothetical protein